MLITDTLFYIFLQLSKEKERLEAMMSHLRMKPDGAGGTSESSDNKVSSVAGTSSSLSSSSGSASSTTVKTEPQSLVSTSFLTFSVGYNIKRSKCPKFVL